MRLIKHVLLLAVGAAFGVATVLSCSDDSPRHSDAATCDCPAGEPPLAGRIIVQENLQMVGSAGGVDNGNGDAGAGCPPGAQLLSGSCTTTSLSLLDVTLKESGSLGSTQPGWRCSFHNNTNSPIQIRAAVTCLIPAQ